MSAGPIRDRSKEILSVADVALPKLYRSLLSCAKEAEIHAAASAQIIEVFIGKDRL